MTASGQAPWQVMPAGQVIRIRDDEIRGELGLLAYLRTARGGRFTAAGQMHGPAPGPGAQPPHSHLLVSRQFTAADDQGTSYTLRFSFRTGTTGSAVWAGVLDLRPDPPHQIGWLDLRTAPGEPATRIGLDPPDPQIPAPQLTVTRTAHSPGELLLDVIAARILTSAGTVPQDNPGPLAGAGLRAFAAISTDYYTRLEQGRLASASEEVLDTLANGLRLNQDERSYLYKLANKTDHGHQHARGAEGVRPQTRQLLENLHDTPALVFGQYLDVLAARRQHRQIRPRSKARHRL